MVASSSLVIPTQGRRSVGLPSFVCFYYNTKNKRMTAFSEYMQSEWAWIILSVTAIFVGMSKTGIQGLTILTVPLLAMTFGAKPSTGLMLPILCFADIIGVCYYRRQAEWKYIVRLLPMAVAGCFSRYSSCEVSARKGLSHIHHSSNNHQCARDALCLTLLCVTI